MPLQPAAVGLGFQESFNFCGMMCLPTSTRMTINENFDSCFIIECIRPSVTNYTSADDPGQQLNTKLSNATILVSADLSAIITKNIFATTSEKLAVITSADAKVVCSENSVPSCPQGNVCAGTTPCPGPRTTV